MSCFNLRCAFIIALVLGQLLARGQRTPTPLSEAAFLEEVALNHPVRLQADLLRQVAEQQQQAARGLFDPQLNTGWMQKRYDNKNYFNYIGADMNIPTLWGADVKLSYENNDGLYLDSESTVPESGLLGLGVKLPLLQGLLFDERRTQRRLAQVSAFALAADRRLFINDLLLQAAEAYWSWSLAYAQWVNSQAFESLARVRFEAVKEAFRAGDRPAVDTLEAIAVLQERQLMLNESRLILDNAVLTLNNFLISNAEATPQAMSQLLPIALANYVPTLPAIDSLRAWEAELNSRHPELQAIDNQLLALDIERRLKREKTKPKLDLTYGWLAGLGNGNEETANFDFRNYKAGVQFSMPLLFRTARAELELQDLKINQTQLKRLNKVVVLQNKLQQAFNKWQNAYEQWALSRQMRDNYRRLYEVEQIKFGVGESSLFLLNSREAKLLEAENKLQENAAKYYLYLNGVRHAAGVLFRA